ncbi:MAG: ABC transporter ATP-binding protein [Melioribacteraceae bacterium]|nr:ABC transporter ATP-binding protein [Melioribacteraceae bacterium]MDD3557175.1 ABC transporter ATP-binding protein [Melioribacteraceae bacterium]
MSIIKVENLVKIYNSGAVPVTAVDGINVEFEKGEFTSIVGPSGCGKTTFLNMLGGLDEPSKGRIVIDSIDISKLKSKQLIDFRLHNIGFVFQAFNLIPVLTVKENIEFIMQLQGISAEEREKRVDVLLEQVGLLDRKNDRPNKLSGGQQQRVAVARALAAKPKFILADEPTANLDSKSTENLLDIMLKLNKTEETTFIFATHDNRVMKKARRLLVLEDGKIIKDEK